MAQVAETEAVEQHTKGQEELGKHVHIFRTHSETHALAEQGGSHQIIEIAVGEGFGEGQRHHHKGNEPQPTHHAAVPFSGVFHGAASKQEHQQQGGDPQQRHRDHGVIGSAVIGDVAAKAIGSVAAQRVLCLDGDQAQKTGHIQRGSRLLALGGGAGEHQQQTGHTSQKQQHAQSVKTDGAELGLAAVAAPELVVEIEAPHGKNGCQQIADLCKSKRLARGLFQRRRCRGHGSLLHAAGGSGLSGHRCGGMGTGGGGLRFWGSSLGSRRLLFLFLVGADHLAQNGEQDACRDKADGLRHRHFPHGGILEQFRNTDHYSRAADQADNGSQNGVAIPNQHKYAPYLAVICWRPNSVVSSASSA